MQNRSRGGERGETLIVAILRPQLDRVEDAEDRRLFTFARIEPQVAYATRHDEPDVVVLDSALRDTLFDHPGHVFPQHGDVEPDRFGGVVESVEVLVEPEDAAAVGTNAFEHAVAIQEAVVEDRNDRAVAVVPGPVDPHHGGHRGKCASDAPW